ncbi:TetR/AcrR family transcriptional regulator [Occultella gossypii]|uniref:TetR/AcrR family transcriptional regulator n=1 Tax=Occultella gossypii TaxID=2800820 RepID=A0ABS7S9T5_9MICO|nr:TetR/AcrR family transcriptional regulator [Occultella gossypii]MBZ2196678.1 TetR/AcrR family transcriptional regulator [Occultella gossypii]
MASQNAVTEGTPARPRRQARGQQRIEEILHAAAAVFGEQGYDATTTNSIAKRAGISPGSLYQFFKNKDDIARALAEHYATQLTALRAGVFTIENLDGAGLEDTVDAVLGPLVAFNLAHPGFKALFARTDMPAGLRDAVTPIQVTIHHRVADLIAHFMPDRALDDIARIATVSIQLVRGMTPLITEADGPERDALTAELRTAVISYLSQQVARVPQHTRPRAARA